MKLTPLTIAISAILAGCTPTAKQDAAAIQTDINSLTPIATKAVDLGLAVTGSAALVPLNDTGSAILQEGQKAILQDLQAPTATPGAKP